MRFISKYLKPIVSGEVNGSEARMLIDTGADYIILSVPKYRIEYNNDKPVLDDNGNYKRVRMYSDTEYDELIRKKYGTFVKKEDGDFVKTTVHGFGDIKNTCRLMILNSFVLDNYEFSDSYVLLDEQGFAKNFDMIIGTACLRNFRIILDYFEKELWLEQKSKELYVNYKGILTNDSKMINGIIELPSDIYLHE